MKIGVVQFIKGAVPTGEEQFFQRFPDEVEFRIAGEGYTWETPGPGARYAQGRSRPGPHARRMLCDQRLDLVVLAACRT